ncbi:MAG: YdcF family protein, partial [Ideonella sp.]
MSEWLGAFDLQTLKPLLTALLLAPVPFLLLIVIATLRLPASPRSSRLVVALAIAGLWLSTTNGAASALAAIGGLAPPAMSAQRIMAIAQSESAAGGKPHAAIVVLGGGLDPWAPEYAAASLSDESLQRLRYGVWLARKTHLPLAFSGGIGWAQVSASGTAGAPGTTEADTAARVAADEFSSPLRWIENSSRDTRENARRSIEMLRADGVDHVLLVTHGWHMRRAVRAFVAEAGPSIRVEPAPMALSISQDGA